MRRLQALGACGAQKVRRLSSKLSRFHAKIVKFFRRFRCKEHCRAQKNLQDLRSMHAMIVRACRRRSACICGCDRADFQKFQCTNRAVFDRKTAQFWCKKSAPHARNARRSRAHAPKNVRHTPATFVRCLQALGACGAQKVRRISSKLPRFQAKIVKFFRRFRFQKHCRAQDNLCDLRSMHPMIVRSCCRRSVCVCGCDRAGFQSFQRKNRAVFDRKITQFCCKKSAPHARSARRSSQHALHNV